jgi:vacuolar protein sorting-associated protein 26
MEVVDGFFKKIKSIVAPATITINLANENSIKKIRKPGTGDKPVLLPLMQVKDPIKGYVTISIPEGKSLEHNGITCEFCGRMQVLGEYRDENNFVSVVTDLEEKGIISGNHKYNFDFSLVRREYETYYGVNVKLQFFYSFCFLIFSFRKVFHNSED